MRVGPTDSGMSLSVDLEESTSGPLLSSSPPAPPLTPPSSPNVQNRDLPWEPLELQLDYWQVRTGFCSVLTYNMRVRNFFVYYILLSRCLNRKVTL